MIRISTVGLAPYVDTPNSRMNIPNKPIEYLFGGFPVISSLGAGVLKDLLVTNQCGLIYQVDDPHSLTSFLLELYNHPEQLQMFSGNESCFISNRFKETQNMWFTDSGGFTDSKIMRKAGYTYEDLVGCHWRISTNRW
ncbi:MAG: hypothetical protein K6U80_11065 [Firmicutes bacterium]|nr:hypothetical protein [Bacillota bacterium]